MIPQLIVGLGNPGAKYAQTRHNVGFDLLDILAKRWQISLSDRKQFQGIYGEGFGSNNAKTRLLKPQTFMNLSGQSVRATLDWFKLPPESVLVVYDDLDLPLGKIRLRMSGSAGGHNGMKSIISHLGTQNFPRVRIGIGKSAGEKDTISHVLGKFSVVETPIVSEVIYLVNDAIEMSLKQGMEKAMSLYNSRSIPVPDLTE
ncbi:MAG: aminoacyl-tRNA hydrolase [Chamaesiphon sp.]|nr:aminoacyl-tRNA hydrolase [Chamaesiphon sp.]